MNFYDDQSTTVGQLFERFFPGREDVIRLLMEPITYANGSTLEDPAISYGIVFSNFMSKGVYTFEGGHRPADPPDARGAGAATASTCGSAATSSGSSSSRGRVDGVQVNGRTIGCRAVVSNANLKARSSTWWAPSTSIADFVEQARAVRLNNSSCQVYMAFKPGVDSTKAWAICCSARPLPLFRTELLLSRDSHQPDLLVLLSAHPARQRSLADRLEHQRQLRRLGQPLAARITRPRRPTWWKPRSTRLSRTCPTCASRSTMPKPRPRSPSEHYTRHVAGASFGTKFEGLAVSRAIPEQIGGLFHAGSVGIIMSGWLGAMNYGVIVANDVDALSAQIARASRCRRGGRNAMSLAEIQAAIPHREPFLLLDEIVERDERRIVCRKTFRRRRIFLRRPLSAVSAHARRAAVRGGDAGRGGAACPAKSGRRAAGRGAGGHADERRPLQADGQAGRNRPDRSRTERAAGRRFFPDGQGDRWPASWPCGSNLPARWPPAE